MVNTREMEVTHCGQVKLQKQMSFIESYPQKRHAKKKEEAYNKKLI